jgi:hypothetical protein
MAAARMDRGGNDLVRGKLLHQEAYAHHVRHRVQGTHFMEVDLSDRTAVDPAFRVGNEGIDRYRVRLDLVRNGQAADQRLNIRDGGMVMVAVMVIMLMFMVMMMPMFVVMLMAVFMMMLVIVVMVMMLVIMVMLMLMRVTGFLLHAVHGDRNMGAGDAALYGRLRGDGNAGQAKGIHFINEGLFVAGQFQQGGGEHIARGAHGAFQVKCFHPEPPY